MGHFHADTIDVEDAQPQQTMTTPELPPRAVVEQHRIDHWPPGLGATGAMRAMDESDVIAEFLSRTGLRSSVWIMRS